MDISGFSEAWETVARVQEDYAAADGALPPPQPTMRARGISFL